MHEDYDLRQEQLNKASILSTKKFLEGLLEMFTQHVVSYGRARCFTKLFNSLMQCTKVVVLLTEYQPVINWFNHCVRPMHCTA